MEQQQRRALAVDLVVVVHFKAYYAGAIKGPVTRYEAENLHAMNFVCQGALGGGVSRSLCLDNYGKALSAAILGFELDVPESLAGLLHGREQITAQ